MPTRSPLKGFGRKPDAGPALLKSRTQCTIFGDLGHHVRWLIVTRDRFKSSMASSEISLEAVSSVSQIPAADWDACANPAADPDSLDGLDTLASRKPAADSWSGSTLGYNPFVSHAFFSALEASGSAGARTGWGPRHLVARLDGAIAGIVPCYLKSHSQGEYVFDRGWADAYERAGGRYYPKLQASVPFTPATGPRLLIRDGVDRRAHRHRAGERPGGAVRRDQGVIGPRHLRARSRMEISGRARLPAAHRPAVSLAQ